MRKRIFFPFIVIFLCFLTARPVYGQESQEGQEGEKGKRSEEAFFKAKTAEVPIIMYHLVTKNKRYLGKHGISPEELENDLKYLKENGYETVVMSDLINFVHKGKDLPNKPIVLTFDDGNSSDYRYLFPLLKKYEMKAVVSVLGKATDECTVLAAAQKEAVIFPNLTWEQIKDMSSSKYIEIQNHSYDLHGKNGSAQRDGEPVEIYHKRLREDLSKTQERVEEMTGKKPNTFTFPLGRVSDNSREVLEELGLIASLSCHDGYNYLKKDDPDCLYRLKRDNRPSGVSISTVLGRMRKNK